ncbi:hypothetical protein C0J52_24072 [Blattella germanica]|nr:hypothetical protein C0J52_24072 [Blattella germanica]
MLNLNIRKLSQRSTQNQTKEEETCSLAEAIDVIFSASAQPRSGTTDPLSNSSHGLVEFN